jgi:hypothetical protein
MTKTSNQSQDFFKEFVRVRKELCKESESKTYSLEEAIRLTFDSFNKRKFELDYQHPGNPLTLEMIQAKTTLSRNDAGLIIEGILDDLIEVGNGTTDEMLHIAADKLFALRDKWFNREIVDYQSLMEEEWEQVEDDKMFPNHSDKDIWMNGFYSAYRASITIRDKEFENKINALNTFLDQTGEDINLWEEEENGPYPFDRFEAGFQNLLNRINK